MTKKIINTGVSANDGSGDTLRQAAGKINDNFDELYGVLDSGLEEAPEDSSDYVRRNAAWVSTSKYVDIDAPGDGTPYARQDSDWVSIPANIEAPTDSIYYGRINSGWQPVTEEAPDDSNDYVRNSKAWSQLTIDVLEAPTDGNAYVRQSSDWTLLDSVNKVPEAPNDGQTYARQSKDWLDVTAFLSTVIPEAPTDGKMYGRQSSDWEVSIEEAPEDSVPYGRFNTSWIDITPEVTNPPTDTIVYGRQDSSWVEVLTDAPGDSTAYGRMDSAWVAVTEEAPIDSVPYARYNGTWVNSTPDVLDAPADSVAYGRYNSDWTAVLTDAPSDSDFYARYNGSWIRVPGESPNVPDAVYGRGDSTWALVTPEAPIDGLPYGRLDAEWVDVTPDVGEAPTDDLIYGRLNGNWSVIAIDSTVTGNFLTDAPGDGQEYVRKDSAWEVATGGGGGGGAASSVDTLICPLDSLQLQPFDGEGAYGKPFYDKTFTVGQGASYDFQHLNKAVEFCNAHPDVPMHRANQVRITLDCSNYDLFDSAGGDSAVAGAPSKLLTRESFVFGNYNYRLRIKQLRLDSSAKFGTIPTHNNPFLGVYGDNEGRFSVDGGATPTGGDTLGPGGNYGGPWDLAVTFDSCNLTGQGISVTCPKFGFDQCVFDSNSAIYSYSNELFIGKFEYGYDPAGLTAPAMLLKNANATITTPTIYGQIRADNSYLNIFPVSSALHMEGNISAYGSKIFIDGTCDLTTKGSIFLSDQSSLRGQTLDISLNETIRVLHGSLLKTRDIIWNPGGYNIWAYDGGDIISTRTFSSTSTGASDRLKLDRGGRAIFKQVPVGLQMYIEGDSDQMDSDGVAGLLSKYGSSLYFDSAI